MKVVMLGHSGVGKTTYMASMYGELQSPVNGLGLRARRRSDHAQLLQMHRSLSGDGYPSPSDQRGAYDFVLTYRARDFFPFTWLDYRGGALGEHRSGEQTRQLMDDLKEADGILVFCDGELLARGPAAARPIGRITSLLGQAIGGFERPVPLGIVLTKADVAGELAEEMLSPLHGLASAVAASERVVGTVIPVACGSRPMNVQVPVLFILHFGIVFAAASMLETMKKHHDRIESFDRQSGFVDDITSFFRGEPTYRALAAKERTRLMEVAGKFEELRPPAEALGAYLDGLHTF